MPKGFWRDCNRCGDSYFVNAAKWLSRTWYLCPRCTTTLLKGE